MQSLELKTPRDKHVYNKRKGSGSLLGCPGILDLPRPSFSNMIFTILISNSEIQNIKTEIL